MANVEDLDLENEILCTICKNEFDDNKLLPKVLQCGHTFCLKCIDTESESSFSECCSKFYCLFNSTNETLLRLVKKIKQKRILKYRKEIEYLKNDIICGRKDLIKEKDEKLNIIDSNLEKIETHLRNLEVTGEKSDLDIESIKQEVSSVKNIKFTPKIFVEESKIPLPFLFEIYGILKSGGKLFTIKQRNTDNFCTKWLCGKISAGAKILYLHCLEQRRPENNEEFIRFSDFKTIAGLVEYRPFLKISDSENSTRIILIKLYESVLLSNFVQLCMGENGTSYKNRCFTRNNEDFTLKMDDSHKADYMSEGSILERDVLALTDSSGTFVYGNYDGSFSLGPFDVAKRCSTIIGRIRRPKDFLNIIKEDSKIVDCGIAFILESGWL